MLLSSAVRACDPLFLNIWIASVTNDSTVITVIITILIITTYHDAVYIITS